MPHLTYARRSRGMNGPERGRPGRFPVGNASTNPLTDFGITFKAAFWAEDPLWTPPADGGAVSSWRDGGTEGVNAVQATGAKQPLYRASTAAFNGRPTIQGDGADDFLQTANWGSALTQGWVTIMVGSISAVTKVLVDGNDGTNRGLLWRLTATDKFNINNGVSLDTTVSGDSNAHRFVVVANGASSAWTIDDTTTTSVNAGTASLDGVTFLANNTGTAATCNGGHIAFWCAMTAVEWLGKSSQVTALNAFLDYHYGL